MKTAQWPSQSLQNFFKNKTFSFVPILLKSTTNRIFSSTINCYYKNYKFWNEKYLNPISGGLEWSFKNLGGAFISTTKETTKYVKHRNVVQAIFKHLATRWKMFTRSCCDDVVTKSGDSIFTQIKAEFTPKINSLERRVYLIWKRPMTQNFHSVRWGNFKFNPNLPQTFTLWRVYIWTFLCF